MNERGRSRDAERSDWYADMLILGSLRDWIRGQRHVPRVRTTNDEVREFQAAQVKLRERTVELLTRRNVLAMEAQCLRRAIRTLVRGPAAYAKRNDLRRLDPDRELRRLSSMLETTTSGLEAAQSDADAAKGEIRRREVEFRERLEQKWRGSRPQGD